MNTGRSWGWMAVVLGMTTGCPGYPNALPPPLEDSSGGTAMDAVATAASSTDASATTGPAAETADTTSVVGTTDESSTTGPAAECGNGEIENGEECDGIDLDGATCESLGFTEAVLSCVDCQFDVSECGPPPGMVEVPGGMFAMGSEDADAEEDEQPIHDVQVDTFYIDETEVTVVAYEACVDDGMCTAPGTGTYCNRTVAGRENHPVNCVDWDQAVAYCKWVDGGTKRLPTEAEWEKAARGMDARTYPWGNSPAPSCVYAVMDDGGLGCGTDATWAVGSKPLGVSPYGAHDMAGNVWEWVEDWYAPYDPAGRSICPLTMEHERVRRGGSWGSNSLNVRAANRGCNPPTLREDRTGFRCARTPPV